MCTRPFTADSDDDTQEVNLLDGLKLIHTYTVQDAVADGVLVDAHEGELAEVTAQHLGTVPTFISCGLFEMMRKAVENPKIHNDWRGVWHDVLTMSAARSRARQGLSGTWPFEVIITGVGNNRKHRLFITLDGAGITLMRPEDD